MFRFVGNSGKHVTLFHLIRRFAPPSPQGKGFREPLNNGLWKLYSTSVNVSGFIARTTIALMVLLYHIWNLYGSAD